MYSSENALTLVIICDNVIAGDISRIFYFTYSKETIVLLSAFVKKTMKTPQIELDRALKYKQDYERSHSDET